MSPPTEIDFPNCVIKLNDSSNNSTILSPISITLTDISTNTLSQTPTSINFNNSTIYSKDTIIINGITGIPNQVLSIDHSSNMVWKDINIGDGGWVGTATSDLNMNNFNMIDVSGISGNTINLQTNSLLLKGVSGSSGQVLSVGSSGSPEWKSISVATPTLAQVLAMGNTATTPLDMGGNNITNTPNVDASSVILNLGTSTASGVTIGKAGQTTNIQGNLQIAGVTGSSGQVLTSSGSSAYWADVLASTWVGTATSDLSMNNFGIFTNRIAPTSNVLTIGNTGVTTSILGKITYGNNNILIGGDAGRIFTSTTDIQSVINVNGREITYIAVLSGNTPSQYITLPNVKSGHYVYIINNSNFDWTIRCQSGEFMALGNNNTGIINGTQNIVKNKTMVFYQTFNTIGINNYQYNILVSESITNTSTNIPTLSDVMTKGNTASASLDMNKYAIIGISGLAGDIINLQTNSLLLKGLSGSSGQVLSVGETGSPEWKTISITTPTLSQVMAMDNTATTALDMGGNNITGVNAIHNNNLSIQTDTSLNLTSPYIDISGQAVFSTPPHIPDPIYGNDAASKGYVDSLVGQYSGGFNLFLNYSVTDTSFNTYKSLGQTVIDSSQQFIDITTNGGPVSVAKFITLPLGITEIPSGLWNTWVYGAVDSTNGNLQYYFTLSKINVLGVVVSITTSSFSPDVNASPNNNPDSYHMNATISTPYTLELTDRLSIELFVKKLGGNSTTVRTYFQNSYYSFTQSTLNAGTNMLSSNNTWTGTNNFILSPTAPTPSINDNSTKLATTEFVNSKLDNFWNGNSTTALDMGGNNIINTPSIDASGVILYLGNTTATGVTIGKLGMSTNIQGNLQIAGNTGNTGQVLTSSGSSAYWANVPSSTWVGTAESELNMNGYNIINTSLIDASGVTLSLGTTTAAGTTVGRATQTTNLVGNVQINSSSGTSGQVLTSTGASTAPTFQALPTPYISASGVASGNIDMNLNSINNCPRLDNSTALNLGTVSTNGVNIGRMSQITNLVGNVRINSSGGTLGQVLTSGGASNAPFWNTTVFPTPYISASGVSSGIIDMGNFTITNSGGLDASGTPLSLGQASSSLGVSIGRATQTTNINGNITINSSAGTSGQVLTSTGPTSAPTFQELPTPYISASGVASGAINMGGKNITNTPNIDASGVTLYLGNTTATGVIIGRSGQTTLLSGDSTQTTAINSTAVGTAFSLCTTMTTGSLTVASNITSGNINIGNTASTGSVNLQAGSGGVRMNSVDRITSGVLSIGSNTLTTAINFNQKPLFNIILGANNFITMSTSNTTNPSANQVGYTTSLSINNSATTSATPNAFNNLNNPTNIPVGTYIIRYSFLIATSSYSTLTISLSQTSGSINPYSVDGFIIGAQIYGSISGTFQFTNNTNNGVYLVAQCPIPSVSITNIYGNLTRIA